MNICFKKVILMKRKLEHVQVRYNVVNSISWFSHLVKSEDRTTDQTQDWNQILESRPYTVIVITCSDT